MKYIKRVIISVSLAALISGCASSGDLMKKFLSISTKNLEELRKDAKVKVFDYDYKICYAKVESILKAMPKTSIYAQDKGMIAVYYIDPNTTPVGVFFKEVDSAHTEVEVSSPGPAAKEWVAKNIFSETVLPETSTAKTIRTGGGGGSKR